jgi:hypothetical protein
MATRIQVRRDTAANWTTSGTTVLAAGEIGFETDTLLFKIGDGSQQWQNLEYAGGTEPIRNNPSGTSVTDLDAAALRNNGNSKYLILGAGSVSNGPSGLTTGTDGQLMVTVAKFDYTGASGSGNERFLMTLQTLTTGRFFYRTYNGSWSSWYEAIRADPATGNVTIAGDLAVNGGDITTNSTGTATVFNANATTLNVGQAATAVSIGATTGTATIRNATTAITGNATVGGSATVGTTLGVTGNTALTGDLAVNGGNITTTNTTASVFDTIATTLNVGGAATTLNVADDVITAQTINIGTGATGTGATKTINIGTGGATGSTTNVNIGDADGGTVSIARDLAVDTDVLKVDATNNRVGINKASPTQALDVVGNLLVSGTANINGAALTAMASATTSDYLKGSGTSQVGSIAVIMQATAAGGNNFFNVASTSGTVTPTSGGPSFGSEGTSPNVFSSPMVVLINGGVTWTGTTVVRPSAGTWSFVAFGARQDNGRNSIMIAVRTA